MDTFHKISEDKLTPEEFWRNTLEGGEITSCDTELDHANFMFQEFDCKNFGDYHDLYLQTDVLILVWVFEEFRKVCYATYGLDCTHFTLLLTCPEKPFSKSAMPKLNF